MEREAFIITTFSAQGNLPCEQMVKNLGGENFQVKDNTTTFEYVTVGYFDDTYYIGDEVQYLDYEEEKAECYKNLQYEAERKSEDIYEALYDAGFEFEIDYDYE